MLKLRLTDNFMRTKLIVRCAISFGSPGIFDLDIACREGQEKGCTQVGMVAPRGLTWKGTPGMTRPQFKLQGLEF